MPGAHRRSLLVGSIIAVAALGVSACTTSSGGSSGSSSSGGGASSSASAAATSGHIGLLLPESQTTRYESADRPIFTARLKAICPGCTLDYFNANQDQALQQNQADQALTKGDKVLVLDPVNGDAAAVIVKNAAAKGVKVLAYDRLIKNAPISAYISFDNEKVGTLQGTALVDKLGAKAKDGKTIVINGSKDDNNAILFNKGAEAALKGKVTIGFDTFTPDWAPETAGREMDQAITKVGKSNIAGVYSANDGMAGAIIASLKRAGVTPLPPVTGQDAELTAVQRILAGDQFMSIYKSYKQEATGAADIAYNLLQGKSITDTASATTANGTGNIPSAILPIVVLTKDNIKTTVIQDGLYKTSQICTSAYAAACTAAGLS